MRDRSFLSMVKVQWMETIRFFLLLIVRLYEFSGIIINILVTIAFIGGLVMKQGRQMYSDILIHSNLLVLIGIFIAFSFFQFFIFLTTIYNRDLSDSDTKVFFSTLFLLPLIVIGGYSISLVSKVELPKNYYSHLVIFFVFLLEAYVIFKNLHKLTSTELNKKLIITTIPFMILGAIFIMGYIVMNKAYYIKYFYRIPSTTILIYILYGITIRALYFYIWLWFIKGLQSRMRLMKMKSKSKGTTEFFQLVYYLTVMGFMIFIATLMWHPYDVRRALQGHELETVKTNHPRIHIDNYTNAFLAKIQKSSSKEPIYIISAQGGGSRAAATLNNFLYKIDKVKKGEFYDHVFAISGVSGGAVGATQYISQMEHYFNNPDLELENFSSKIYEYNFVSASMFNLFFINAINNLLYFKPLFKFDRNAELLYDESYNLENRILNRDIDFGRTQNDDSLTTKPYLYRSLYSYYFDQNNRVRTDHPLLITNSYDLVSHKRILASPFQFSSFFDNYIDILDEIEENTGGQNTLSLGTAAGISQYFPVINAVGFYETKKQLITFYDGGVYDNSSFQTVHELYNYLKAKLVSRGEYNRKIVVISLKNFNINKPFKVPMNAIEAFGMATTSSILYSRQSNRELDLKSDVERRGDRYVSLNCYEVDEQKEITLSRWLTKSELIRIDQLTSEEIEAKF